MNAPSAPGPSARTPPSGRPTGSPLSPLRSSLTLLLLLVIGAGIVYPGAVTVFAQLANPAGANGSLAHDPNGTAYGSSLLGENITNPALFWLRPSLIDYQTFNASGGSNGPGNEVPYGPTDPALLNATRYYIGYYLNATGTYTPAELANLSIPVDLLTPSASGLDPDLTPAAVLIQVPRVSNFSGINESVLTEFVLAHVQAPALGYFGARYVNVVALDVALLPLLPAGM